jgi:glycosyltransferase involved in cell wall biosynthesis
VKVWKELQVIQKTKDKVQNWEQIQNTKYKVQNAGIKLIIAWDGSLKNWLLEQGAIVIPYYEGLLEQIQNTKYTIQNWESIQNTKYKVQSEGSEKVQQIQNTKYKVQSEGIVDSDSKIETQNSQLPPEMTQSDTLAIYLSTIDAFGMCPLEAQIAGLPTIIFDKWGARETQLLDSFWQPMAQLVHTETEIIEAITYFIQQKSLHKSMSNVNFCHHTEYFSPSRLDADIRSLIDSVR